MWNNCHVLEKLLCYGGSPWLHDFDGKNAFDLAKENCASECYDYLISFKRQLRAGSDISDCAERSVSIFSSLHDLSRDAKNANENLNEKCNDLDCITESINALVVNEGDNCHSDSSEIIDTFERIKLWLKEADQHQKSCSIKRESSDYFSDFSKFKERSLSSISGCTHDSEDEGDSQSEAFSKTSEDLSCASDVDEVASLNVLDATWGTLLNETLNHTMVPSMASSEHEIEITHTDDEEGIVLIERWGSSFGQESVSNQSCVSSSSGKTSWKSFKTAREKLSSSSSSISEELKQLSNTQIFAELKKRGDYPGPVTDSTRHLYLLRLFRLQNGLAPKYPLSPAKYSPELTSFLNDKLDLQNAERLEQQLSADFDRDSMLDNWREGGQRCSFNYFLLDPRVTRNLPLRAQTLSFKDTMAIFLSALFYVGKGTRSRPFHHLYEAAKVVNMDGECDKPQLSSKVLHILDIWKSGLGVICLHCFQNSIPAEAYTREACIIDAVGLSNLTNIKKGNFYGVASKWTGSKKKQVGVLLLSRALKIFCLEGERFIRPKDIKKDDVPDA